MREAWLFSAKQAWQRPFFKWMTVAIATLFLVGTGFFFLKLAPQRNPTGTFVIHYSIYLGIDQVGGWEWVLLLPVAWLIPTVIDLFFAYGLFRKDPFLANSLLCLALVWSLPWLGAFYYLTIVNV